MSSVDTNKDGAYGLKILQKSQFLPKFSMKISDFVKFWVRFDPFAAEKSMLNSGNQEKKMNLILLLKKLLNRKWQ